MLIYIFYLLVALFTYNILRTINIKYKLKFQFYLDKSKTILITGGCSGIGKELIKIFVCDYKCRVINIDIRDDLFYLISDFDKERVINFKCDLGNREETNKIMKIIIDKFDKIDILINNAGIANNKSFSDLNESEFIRTVDINLVSPMILYKKFIEAYLNKGKIHIVTMASVMSHFIANKSPDYICSKWGLYSFHESVRYDYYNHPQSSNINFTVLCPFAVDTGMFPGFVPPTPLIGLLKASYVARETVNSIILKDKILFIPFYMEYICFIFKLIPCSLRDLLYFTLSKYNKD